MTKDELLGLIAEAAADGRTELDLSRKLPSEFCEPSWLQRLNPSSNPLSNLLKSISQLTKLQSLDLSFNRLISLPESAGQLTNLHTLILSHNRLDSLPESIGQLTNLHTLILSNNRLSNLPESTGQLTNLQSLHLNSNELNSLPESIGQLTNLQSLYLSHNQLSSLPGNIGQLTSLRSFLLSNNHLSSLPESVGQLINLQSLDLSSNHLSILPGIVERLTKLHTLNLSHNQLSSLPDKAKALSRLSILDLRCNHLPIPPEILGTEKSYKLPSPSKVLDFYFSLQTEEGSALLYEAKLILVGEGGAGKTSLAKKIHTETYQLQTDEETTQGIDVIRWNFLMENGSLFRVNIWDFGGQEIYHATHQFFLTKRSLYLLVADTRQGNTDFAYWLNVVELLSDNSPVIIIKNEKQDRHCEIDEGLFRSQFNNLKDSLSTNLADNRGLTQIKDAIRFRLSQLPHVGTALPTFWVNVRTDLEETAQKQNTLALEQYFDICRRHDCTDKQRMLFVSEYLHDLGVCLHFQKDPILKRTLILRPEWATTAVYKVTDSNTVRNNQGYFTAADLAIIWQSEQYADFRDELLQLMMRFKLAYEIPTAPGHYIAPQLLPVSQPFYPWDITGNLILRYRYDFMPKGILTRFIVETHRLIENQNHVWKNGVVLADKWARAQVIENYLKSEVNICISGINKKPLLETVRNEFRRIHDSYEHMKYQELIPCNCAKCKGSAEPEFYAYDLLMQYIARGKYEIECRTSIERVDVRRLISDITAYPVRDQPVSAQNTTNYYIDQVSGNLINQTAQERITDMSTVNQYGQGDNIAGDKVMRDKIQTQVNSNPDLAQAAHDIKALLDELSEEYNPNSARGQAKIKEAAIAKIKQNPTLKQRSFKALKSAGEEALEQAIQHPVAKVVVVGIKGFLEG